MTTTVRVRPGTDNLWGGRIIIKNEESIYTHTIVNKDGTCSILKQTDNGLEELKNVYIEKELNYNLTYVSKLKRVWKNRNVMVFIYESYILQMLINRLNYYLEEKINFYDFPLVIFKSDEEVYQDKQFKKIYYVDEDKIYKKNKKNEFVVINDKELKKLKLKLKIY